MRLEECCNRCESDATTPVAGFSTRLLTLLGIKLFFEAVFPLVPLKVSRSSSATAIVEETQKKNHREHYRVVRHQELAKIEFWGLGEHVWCRKQVAG